MALCQSGLADGYPDLDNMRGYAREGKDRPTDRAAFWQYNLNCWLDYSAAPFVDMPIYDEGSGIVDLEDKEATQEPCWLAVDLSSNSDLTAVVAVWGAVTGDMKPIRGSSAPKTIFNAALTRTKCLIHSGPRKD